MTFLTLEAQEVLTKGVYRLPHVSTRVASLCHTLRELLALRPRETAWPNPSVSATVYAQGAEGLHLRMSIRMWHLMTLLS